jgi:DNA-binding NarL/FixJ family response regulator
MINVLIIGITEQLKQAVEDEGMCVSFCDDEVQALNATEKEKSPVILLDYRVRKAETDEYIKLLLDVSADSKVVVIANELNDKDIFACLIAGARGYQNINGLSEYAVKMIKVVDAGEAWITRRMVAKLLDVLMQEMDSSLMAEHGAV